MKTLFMIFLLTLLASCGSGGGGSSADVKTGNGDTPDIIFPEDDEDKIYEYRLIVNGVAGTSFASVAYRDFGGADQAMTPWSYVINASQTQNIAIFGRSIYWQVQKNGGGDLNLVITRDGVEVQNVTITDDGVTEILTDNI